MMLFISRGDPFLWKRVFHDQDRSQGRGDVVAGVDGGGVCEAVGVVVFGEAQAELGDACQVDGGYAGCVDDQLVPAGCPWHGNEAARGGFGGERLEVERLEGRQCSQGSFLDIRPEQAVCDKGVLTAKTGLSDLQCDAHDGGVIGQADRIK